MSHSLDRRLVGNDLVIGEVRSFESNAVSIRSPARSMIKNYRMSQAP
jgi:hypothetical protein